MSKSSRLLLFINKSLFGCFNKENFQGKFLHFMSLFAFICVVLECYAKRNAFGVWLNLAQIQNNHAGSDFPVTDRIKAHISATNKASSVPQNQKLLSA